MRLYIYQNGKLYTQDGDKLVGVEIYPDHVIKVEGTETELAEVYDVFTPYEVKCKWHINEGESYIFPREIKKAKEVDANEPITKPKRTPRKSTGK